VLTSTHGADSTIIDGNQLGRVVTFNGGEDSTAYLIGFTIQNGLITTANSDGGGIFISHSSPTLENLKVINNTSDDDGGGISCHIASDVASYPTLRNILIANNTSADDGGGVHVVASHPNLYNVTIVNNISGDDGGGINIGSSQGNPSNVDILNSIIRDNSSNWHNTNSNLNITYSNIGYGYEGTGNIDVDPLFCNPDSGDFTLAENSPCVGAGQDSVNMGAFDVGCEPILAIDDEIIPIDFALHPPYPNPFNPTTTIRFDLVETWHATSLHIFDITGRVVETLVNGQIESGQHKILWNASKHSSGIYFVELVAGEKRDVQKLILLK